MREAVSGRGAGKEARRAVRSLSQNARFHASLSEWATLTGQDAAALKRRVKRSMGAYTDLPLYDDAWRAAIKALATVLHAMGWSDLLRMLPDGRAVRIYESSTRWDKARMALAIETVHMLASEEGHTLGPKDNWHE